MTPALEVEDALLAESVRRLFEGFESLPVAADEGLTEDDGEGDLPAERTEANRNQYSRDRSARTSGRRAARAAKRIGLGIAARRQRRWTW